MYTLQIGETIFLSDSLDRIYMMRDSEGTGIVHEFYNGEGDEFLSLMKEWVKLDYTLIVVGV